MIPQNKNVTFQLKYKKLYNSFFCFYPINFFAVRLLSANSIKALTSYMN